MTPRTAIAGAAGIVGLLTIGGALAGPLAGIADAHSATIQIVNQHCDKTVWAGTLTITPTDLDKSPVATVADGVAPMTVTSFPYSHVFTTDGTKRTITVTINWNDGVSWGPGSVALTPPEGGCAPPTTTTVPGTTSTTTCAQANPPRVDCGTTTVPPTTVPATVPPTTVAPPASSEVPAPSSSSAPTVPPGTPNRVARSTPAPAPPTALPATGAADAMQTAGIAVLFVAVGALIVIVTRRRGK